LRGLARGVPARRRAAQRRRKSDAFESRQAEESSNQPSPRRRALAWASARLTARRLHGVQLASELTVGGADGRPGGSTGTCVRHVSGASIGASRPFDRRVRTGRVEQGTRSGAKAAAMSSDRRGNLGIERSPGSVDDAAARWTSAPGRPGSVAQRRIWMASPVRVEYAVGKPVRQGPAGCAD